MKEHIDYVIEYLKKQPIKGCITGSCLLGYFENQDVDLFVYDEKSFTKILFNLYYNNNFLILDPLEKWKLDQYLNKEHGKAPFGITTIKFVYNTCIPVNVIFKKGCINAFSVLASFDMDIICKAYDIETRQYLDLSENLPNKQATWNKWNTNFYDPELWQIGRILRQLERVIKYHKRGYNTDAVCIKYIELIDEVQKFQNIFNSNNFSEKLAIRKNNTKIVKQICEVWLKTHEISDEQLELLKEKIKEI
ncbi:MAG: hypothetical protein GX421_10570 [Caldisericales bacterium]|nr:hypothetical protein [Caldisericales bacterium]